MLAVRAAVPRRVSGSASAGAEARPWSELADPGGQGTPGAQQQDFALRRVRGAVVFGCWQSVRSRAARL